MHLASLYHDDVMDEAEVRRNGDSVNARYGNLIAIVAGDYLMARSAATEADYFAAIEGKTAALMASSCHVGALTAELPDAEREALTEFGRCFGMIYQLRDDILDVTATDNELGKPAGQDLAEGIYNLPTIFALRDASIGDELHSVLGAILDDEERERARKLVVATDGIERTMLAAQDYLAQAHNALSVLPNER